VLGLDVHAPHESLVCELLHALSTKCDKADQFFAFECAERAAIWFEREPAFNDGRRKLALFFEAGSERGGYLLKRRQAEGLEGGSIFGSEAAYVHSDA
jgi:hypothetical protein